MRVPLYFLMGAPLLPRQCQPGVPNNLYLRIDAAAVTGTALVASKVGRVRTDALQVRKRNPPTQLNAGSEPKAEATNLNALLCFALVWWQSATATLLRAGVLPLLHYGRMRRVGAFTS
jgi:hypothetical protein